MDAIEKRARELLAAEWERDGYPASARQIREGKAPEVGKAVAAIIAALTPPEGSDQSLLELAATFETCIPFLPSAGQKNIGKAVAQLRNMAMGYVLVPVKPTEEMKRAFSGYRPIGSASFACRYEEMLAARPEVP